MNGYGKFVPLALALAVAATAGQAEDISPLFRSALPQEGPRELTAVKVDFAPGDTATPHRHGNAFVYAYVLSGAVESQLEGGSAHTYRAGESWSEPPGAHHVLTRNPSSSERAELLVIFVAKPEAPLKIDDAVRPLRREKQR